MSDSPRVLIALCTYNERQNVEQLIPLLRAAVPDADLLFVDDNSPDGTGQYIREIGASDPRVLLLHREKKEGLGVAVRAGFTFAVEQEYDLLVNLDADFSHPPAVIPQLVKAAQNADVVLQGAQTEALARTQQTLAPTAAEVATQAAAGNAGLVVLTGAENQMVAQRQVSEARATGNNDVIAGRLGMLVELPLANSEINVRPL